MMETLTIDDLKRVYAYIKKGLWIHPADASLPLVASFRNFGYEVTTTNLMPHGIGWFQNPEKMGVLYLEQGEAVIGNNTMLEWFRESF